MSRRPRPLAAIPHPPHEVDDVSALLAHLVAQHDYTAEALSGGTRSFLTTLHERAHQRMAEDRTTAAELAGSAERLFTTALETAEALVPLDHELVRRLTGRWAQALAALALPPPHGGRRSRSTRGFFQD